MIHTPALAHTHARKPSIPRSSALASAIIPGSARASRAVSGASPETTSESWYAKRRLPHFERPWEKYAIAFSTYERRPLSPKERDVVLRSAVYAHEHRQCELYVACVMPDHVHLLFEPQIKGDNAGKTVFWSLSEILHGVKSSTAHCINKARAETGPVWEKESFDRLIRSGRDLQEKFLYICRNPWDSHVVGQTDDYPWLWTQDMSLAGAPKTAREGACAPQTRSCGA
jgi:putative transposase